MIQPIRRRYNHDTRCFGIQSKIHTVKGVFISYVSHDTRCFGLQRKIRASEGVFVLYHDMFCRIPTTLVSIVELLFWILFIIMFGVLVTCFLSYDTSIVTYIFVFILKNHLDNLSERLF